MVPTHVKRHRTRSVAVCRGKCVPLLIPDRADRIGDLLPRKTAGSKVSQSGLLSSISLEQLAHANVSPLGTATTAPDQISVVSIPCTPRLEISGRRRRLCDISRKRGSISLMGRLRVFSHRAASFGSVGRRGNPCTASNRSSAFNGSKPFGGCSNVRIVPPLGRVMVDMLTLCCCVLLLSFHFSNFALSHLNSFIDRRYH
jgi:hypothetical protein